MSVAIDGTTRRGAIDVLRRAVDNTIANWPLILVRIAEMVLFGIIGIVAFLAAVTPLLVSLGIELSKIRSEADIENAALALMGRWIVLVWFFVALTVLALLFVLVHSFVVAGSARVYVDAERNAGPATEGVRTRFRVFSMERWLAGAREGWWSVFWIYNIAWGAAGLILLLPLLPTIAGMLLFREQPPAAIATGCVGLAVTGFLLIFVGAVTGIWVNRAIAEWAVRRNGARDALSIAWRAFRADLGRHLILFVAMFVIAMAGSSFFSSFSFIGASFNPTSARQAFDLFVLPFQLVGSLLSSIFSAIVGAWYLAAYSSLAAE